MQLGTGYKRCHRRFLGHRQKKFVLAICVSPFKVRALRNAAFVTDRLYVLYVVSMFVSTACLITFFLSGNLFM